MKDNHNKRALRRHHVKRLKRKRASYYWWWGENDPKRIGKIVNTPCMCSCSGCGNPRRQGWDEKRTIQERKHFLDSIEDLLEDV